MIKVDELHLLSNTRTHLGGVDTPYSKTRGAKCFYRKIFFRLLKMFGGETTMTMTMTFDDAFWGRGNASVWSLIQCWELHFNGS